MDVCFLVHFQNTHPINSPLVCIYRDLYAIELRGKRAHYTKSARAHPELVRGKRCHELYYLLCKRAREGGMMNPSRFSISDWIIQKEFNHAPHTPGRCNAWANGVNGDLKVITRTRELFDFSVAAPICQRCKYIRILHKYNIMGLMTSCRGFSSGKVTLLYSEVRIKWKSI